MLFGRTSIGSPIFHSDLFGNGASSNRPLNPGSEFSEFVEGLLQSALGTPFANDLTGTRSSGEKRSGATAFSRVRSNVLETEKGYRYEFLVPGLTREDVELEVEEGVFRLKLKERSGEGKEDNSLVLRSFKLPRDVQEESSSAELVDGVLKVSFEKKPELAPKRIEIR